MGFGIFKTEKKVDEGLYLKGFEKRVLEKNKILLNINPLFADKHVLNEAAAFSRAAKLDYWNAAYDLFDKIRIGGSYGIRYDITSPRPDGVFNASEVLNKKTGCCLEQTFLFLSITTNAGFNTRQTDVIGFLVYRLENGFFDLHACPGIIVRPSLRGEYSKLDHHKFRTDAEFREKTMKLANLPVNEDASLVIFDLTYPKIGAQHKQILAMNDDSIIAASLTNSGANFYQRKKIKDAVLRWTYALSINEHEVLALSNLIENEWKKGDWKKVIALTENISMLVNPTDLLKRSEANKNLNGLLSFEEPYTILSQDPKCIDAYFYLAEAYAQTNDKHAALSLLSSLRKKLRSTLNECYRQMLTSVREDGELPKNLGLQIQGLENNLAKCEGLIQSNIDQ